MKTTILRKLQLFWAYFIGIGAAIGFTMMMIDPAGTIFGFAPLRELLINALPFATPLFQNFIPSGIVLLLVVGLPNFVSIILIHKRLKFDKLSSLLSGIILLLWICLEFYIWGFAAASVIYGIFALLQMANAVLWMSKK